MRIVALIIVWFLILGCDTSRNTPDPSHHFFIRYYGVDGDQEGVDLLANDDGTFMLLGNSKINSESPSQIYLVKVNQDGMVLWERFYGSAADETARDIEPTSDGNFVIVGNIKTPASGTDILLLTIDANGNQLKTGTFSYPGTSDEVSMSVTQVMSGSSPAGFIVAGHTNYDPIAGNGDGFEAESALFARFNDDCTAYQGVWTEHAGADKNDFCTRIIQTGNLTDPYPFLFFGYSNSDPGSTLYNYWKATMNNGGGGLNFSEGIISGSPANVRLGSVTLSQTGTTRTYFLSGVASNSTGNDNIFITKLITDNLVIDGIMAPQSIGLSLGDILNKGTDLQKVTAYPSKDLGYLIAATSVTTGNSNMVLTKIDVEGNLVWDVPVTLGGAGEDYSSGVSELPDGRIIVMGTMQIGDDKQSKMTLIKINAKGQFKD